MPFPWLIVPKTDDEKFMLEALKEAWKAFQADEVPVGAVLVKDKQIIARGHNQVELLRCPNNFVLHDRTLRHVRRGYASHKDPYPCLGSSRYQAWG